MMTKLSEFYSQRKALSGGKEPSLMHELAWEATEEKLIREEVLPELLQRIAPVLSEVESPLSLHIDYQPNGNLSVSFNRNTAHMPISAEQIESESLETNTDDDAEDLLDNDEKLDNDENEGLSVNEPNGSKSRRKKIRVTTPEGKVIFYNTVWYTLRDVILYAGIGRVQALGLLAIERSGIPLLANTRTEKYANAQHEIAAGVYLFTNTNTPTKLKEITDISNKLNLNFKIEEIWF